MNHWKCKDPGIAAYKRYYKQYRANARRANRGFSIAFDAFVEISSKPCVYCGELAKLCNPFAIYSRYSKEAIDRQWVRFNGIDRIDNSLGYVDGNCAPCCLTCNAMKSNLSRDEFLNHVGKIASFKA